MGNVLDNEDLEEVFHYHLVVKCIDTVNGSGNRNLYDIICDSIDTSLPQMVILSPYYSNANNALIHEDFTLDGITYELRFISRVYDEINDKWKGEVYSCHGREFSSWFFSSKMTA
eukprot:867599-Ditylum_brightwellii.AAC.1